MRLLSFNIAHARGLFPHQGMCSQRRIYSQLDKIAELVCQTDADVVALQEIDQGSAWTRGVDCLDYLKERTGYDYGVMGAHAVRGGWLPLCYGNAILSRYPIVGSDLRLFKSCGYARKGFLFARLETEEGCLGVVNVHLDAMSRRRRRAQVRELCSFLASCKELPIVCGDFNTPLRRHQDGARLLHEYFEGNDCACAVYPACGRTFPSYMPARALDFAFIPGQYRGIAGQILPTRLSDHRPILIDCEIPVNRA